MDRNFAKYLLGKTTEDYNLIADQFSRARPKIWEEMKFLFDDYLIEGEKVLDLGCGNGRFYETFKKRNIDYIGVDSSEKLIEIAKNRYLHPVKSRKAGISPKAKLFNGAKAKFQTAQALNLPFPNNFFDKVYSIAVLHHIPSEEFRIQFLTEAKRVLKPNGLLILTVWNLWQKKTTRNLIFKFALLKIFTGSKLDFKDIFMKWEGRENCYFHCFSQKELEKLVKRADFQLKRRGEILVGGEKAKKSKWPNSNFYIIAEK